MIKEIFVNYKEKEKRYFDMCRTDNIKKNMKVQKNMSVASAAIFLALLIFAKIIIPGFYVHPNYYLFLVMLIVFFGVTQFLSNKEISYKAMRIEALAMYGMLYFGMILIDCSHSEAPAALFPFFMILFVIVYIDETIVYILFHLFLTAIFLTCVCMVKTKVYISRDLFEIIASLSVTGVISIIVQNLRINGAINESNLTKFSQRAAEAEAEAIAANNAKSQFLSQMSHEIRTPINAILGMNELILREYEDDNLLKYAHNIKSASTTLLALVNDVLDFSKIEAGKMELYKVEYDLAGLISELVSMVDERARNKGLELKVTVNEEMPHLLYGDNVRLKQIILNILTNAVKYTETGQVHLDVDYFVSGHLEENGEIDLKISVSDTGIGIREEDMERLFSPFERIEEGRNRKVEGTGLGMSIVQKLLGLMNSELNVRSEYGKGSTFSFIVKQETRSWNPIGDFNVAYEKLVKAENDYRQLFEAPNAEILIVDDNEINLVVAKNLLKDTKVKITTAASGNEALKICSTKEFDLILIDHRMPGMDGMEMLWRLRSNDKSPNQNKPTIALTANVFSGAREVYKNSGFQDYLAKPIIGDALEKILMEYLPNDKVILTDGRAYKKHMPKRSVKYETTAEDLQEETKNINAIREDYSDDAELYAAIGLLMKRANISG